MPQLTNLLLRFISPQTQNWTKIKMLPSVGTAKVQPFQWYHRFIRFFKVKEIRNPVPFTKIKPYSEIYNYWKNCNYQNVWYTLGRDHKIFQTLYCHNTVLIIYSLCSKMKLDFYLMGKWLKLVIFLWLDFSCNYIGLN